MHSSSWFPKYTPSDGARALLLSADPVLSLSACVAHPHRRNRKECCPPPKKETKCLPGADNPSATPRCYSNVHPRTPCTRMCRVHSYDCKYISENNSCLVPLWGECVPPIYTECKGPFQALRRVRYKIKLKGKESVSRFLVYFVIRSSPMFVETNQQTMGGVVNSLPTAYTS